jgi:hypothetical protein
VIANPPLLKALPGPDAPGTAAAPGRRGPRASLPRPPGRLLPDDAAQHVESDLRSDAGHARDLPIGHQLGRILGQSACPKSPSHDLPPRNAPNSGTLPSLMGHRDLVISDEESPRMKRRSLFARPENRLRTALHLGAALPGGGGECRGCSPRCQAVAQGGRSTGPRAGRPPGHQVPKVLPHSWAEDRSGRRGGGW